MRKQMIIAALITMPFLMNGMSSCSAKFDEVVSTVAAGIGAYQAAKTRNCDAINGYVVDVLDNIPSCKTKNLILDLEAAAEQSCRVAASPNPPAGNLTKAGLIIDNTLVQIKANRLKC